MIRYSFFREEAALRHAQPDSLDGLARVDLPHHQLASKLVVALLVIGLILLTLSAMRGGLDINALPIQETGTGEIIFDSKSQESPDRR